MKRNLLVAFALGALAGVSGIVTIVGAGIASFKLAEANGGRGWLLHDLRSWRILRSGSCDLWSYARHDSPDTNGCVTFIVAAKDIVSIEQAAMALSGIVQSDLQARNALEDVSAVAIKWGVPGAELLASGHGIVAFTNQGTSLLYDHTLVIHHDSRRVWYFRFQA